MSNLNFDDHAAFIERLRQITSSTAALSKASGISGATIYAWQHGSEPSRDKLIVIADATGVSVEWLATGRGSKTPSSGKGPKAASAPEGYIEVPCFNLSGIGPYVRGMIGEPTGTRLFKKDDFPEHAGFPDFATVTRSGLIAAVEGCQELSFKPTILGGDVFIYERIIWTSTARLRPIEDWGIGDYQDDISLIADGADLKLRQLRHRKNKVLVIDSDGKLERTLTGAPGDFTLFGRILWRSGMLPGASELRLAPPQDKK